MCQPGVLLPLLYSGVLDTVTLELEISFPRRLSLKGGPGKGRPEVNEPRGGIGIGLPENILRMSGIPYPIQESSGRTTYEVTQWLEEYGPFII